jgi:hypothetical protein
MQIIDEVKSRLDSVAIALQERDYNFALDLLARLRDDFSYLWNETNLAIVMNHLGPGESAAAARV